MLGRKVSGSGMMMSAAAGTITTDRGRVAERLHAALAGLQELHLLKEKQGDMVHWALRMDREEPVVSSSSHSSVQTAADAGCPNMGAEEQRLEASLTALKQQLCRLRRQDVGLKSHLQQLDQQISELKLDVGKASTEQQLESDSRPSSGFYELSDGGSCSLSNSCTSVYSECLSSSSQTSLLISAGPTSPTACHTLGPSSSQADVCRRRSADETVTQPYAPRATGVHLGSCRIRVGTDRARPRPVSTGDLDKVMTLGLGCYKSACERKSSMCTNLKTSIVDPKFQNNLVSRSGTEMYQYPSPLHAVALQSPIFALDGEPAIPGLSEGTGPQADGVPKIDTPQRAQGMSEIKPLGYIDKVLQRSMSKINIQGDAGRDTLRADYHREASEVQTMSPEVPNVQVSPLQPTSVQTPDTIPAESHRNRRCIGYSGKEQANIDQSVRAPDVSYRYSYPAAMRDYSSSEAVTCTARNNGKIPGDHASAARTHSEKRYRDIPMSRGVEKNVEQRHLMNHSSSTEESHGFEVHVGHNSSAPDFVHAKFVPAGSQRVKVRQADRKTKAVKLRRRSTEKPKGSRHPQGYSERTVEASGGLKARSGKGKMTQRLPSCLEELGHSGSDSSLYSPGPMHTHRVYPKPHQIPPIAKCSKGRRPQGLELEPSAEQRKRRQGTTKWPTDMEMHQAACGQRQRPREPHTQALASRQVVRSVSTRSHSDHWAGHRRAFQPAVSAASFFSSLNARYPAAPFPMSSQYPPRCESEYSAECASLFHSTIAESSEGEMSDNTTNRFGDSEFSQSFRSHSDSDSSLSTDEEEEEGGLVWPEAALGPTAAGLALQQQPRPEPPACRIKASRALKKKIRRFQPAGMKIMTLV